MEGTADSASDAAEQGIFRFVRESTLARARRPGTPSLKGRPAHAESPFGRIGLRLTSGAKSQDATQARLNTAAGRSAFTAGGCACGAISLPPFPNARAGIFSYDWSIIIAALSEPRVTVVFYFLAAGQRRRRWQLY